jgi:hypothetical protein
MQLTIIIEPQSSPHSLPFTSIHKSFGSIFDAPLIHPPQALNGPSPLVVMMWVRQTSYIDRKFLRRSSFPKFLPFNLYPPPPEIARRPINLPPSHNASQAQPEALSVLRMCQQYLRHFTDACSAQVNCFGSEKICDVGIRYQDFHCISPAAFLYHASLFRFGEGVFG